MKYITKIWLTAIGSLFVFVLCMQAQTKIVGVPLQLFSGTTAAIPATCTVGQVYFSTNATAGQNLYYCTATNTWTQGSGGGGTSSPFVTTTANGNNISTAIATIPSGGTVIANASISGALTTSIPSNITVQCLPGVTITITNPAVFAFDMTGATNATLQDCTVVGGLGGLSGYNMNFDRVINNDISGWAAGGWGVNTGQNNFNFEVTNNYIHDGAADSLDPIFIEDPGATVIITGNIVTSTAANGSAHGIGIHTFASGGNARGVMIKNNYIFHAGGNFAIEVGSFGTSSNTIAGCQITGNQIIVIGTSNGGISLDGTHECDVSGNDINLNSNAPAISGIEIVKSQYTSVNTNKVYGSPADSRVLWINRSSNTVVDGNYFQGYTGIENSGPSNLDMSDNRLVNNTFEMPSGSTNLYLIHMQCNFGGCTALRNYIGENTFTGQSLASSYAVLLEEDTGTIDGTQLPNNWVTGFPAGNRYSIGAGVTNTQIGPQPTTTGLTFTGTQFIPTGLAAPTIAVGAAAGTSPGTPTITGYNADGIVTVITGTATTTSATLATVTFNGTLETAPVGCALFPRNAATALQSGFIYTTSPSTTAWTIAVGASAVAISTTYVWSYHCE